MRWVAIVGSRRRNTAQDEQAVRSFVRRLKPEWGVVSGGCIGVDTWAIDEAVKTGRATQVFSPDMTNVRSKWQATQALYARNKQVAEFAAIVVAFVSTDRTGGTESTIRFAQKAGRRIMLK